MVAASKLGIWNLGLSFISQAAVGAIGDGSIQDVELEKIWDFNVRETLASFNWGFAKVQDALTVTTAYDPTLYTYAYVYPTNCLAIRKVNVQTELDNAISGLYEIMYDVANDVRRIVTNIQDAYVEYTYYVETVSLWSDYFNTTLARKNAADLAMSLNGDADMAKAQGAIFNNLISEAQRHGAGERFETHEGNEKSAFVNARA